MTIIHYIVVAAFIMHGLAHFSGFIASWTKGGAGFTPNPSLLSKGLTLQSPLGKVFGLLWLGAVVALVGSGLDLVFHFETWPLLPIARSLVSLLVIVPWWNTVPPGAKAGAAFDLLTLLALLSPWKEQILQSLLP
jgi:hypothetical protein